MKRVALVALLLALGVCQPAPLDGGASSMATNYTGLETNTQAPSPTPGTNTVPIIVNPDDSDALNVASIIQGRKALADMAAYLNRVHNFRKTSNDDTALVRHENSASNLRSSIDHNGFPLARVSMYLEDFTFEHFVTGASGPSLVTGYSKWVHESTANGTTGTPANLANGLNGALVQTEAAAVNGNLAGLRQSAGATIGLAATFQSLVFTWEAELSNVGANNVFVHMGWRSASATNFPTAPSTVQQYAIYKASANTNWQAACAGGATLTQVDTGVPPVAGVTQQFRMELHGSTTAYAADTARFFIDGVLVATITTNIASGGSGGQFMFSVAASASPAAARGLRLGNLQMARNYLASPSHL